MFQQADKKYSLLPNFSVKVISESGYDLRELSERVKYLFNVFFCNDSLFYLI